MCTYAGSQSACHWWSMQDYKGRGLWACSSSSLHSWVKFQAECSPGSLLFSCFQCLVFALAILTDPTLSHRHLFILVLCCLHLCFHHHLVLFFFLLAVHSTFPVQDDARAFVLLFSCCLLLAANVPQHNLPVCFTGCSYFLFSIMCFPCLSPAHDVLVFTLQSL